MRKTLMGAALVAAGIFVTVTTAYSFPILLHENDSYEILVTPDDMLTVAEQSPSPSTGSTTLLQIFVADDEKKDEPEKASITVNGYASSPKAYVIPTSSSEGCTWEFELPDDLTLPLEVVVTVDKGDLLLTGVQVIGAAGVAHAPIPSTILLFSAGLIGLAGIKRRFKK